VRGAHVSSKDVLLDESSITQTANEGLFSGVVPHLMSAGVRSEPALVGAVGALEGPDNSVAVQLPVLVEVGLNPGGVLARRAVVQLRVLGLVVNPDVLFGAVPVEREKVAQRTTEYLLYRPDFLHRRDARLRSIDVLINFVEFWDVLWF